MDRSSEEQVNTSIEDEEMSRNEVQQSVIQTNSNISNNIEQEENKLPTGDSLDGWNTYTNTELGFSFRYPEAWGEIFTTEKNHAIKSFKGKVFEVFFENKEDIQPRIVAFSKDWQRFQSPFLSVTWDDEKSSMEKCREFSQAANFSTECNQIMDDKVVSLEYTYYREPGMFEGGTFFAKKGFVELENDRYRGLIIDLQLNKDELNYFWAVDLTSEQAKVISTNYFHEQNRLEENIKKIRFFDTFLASFEVK